MPIISESKKREAEAETSQTQQRRRTTQRWNFKSTSTNDGGSVKGQFSLVVDQCVKSSALSVVLGTPVEGAVTGPFAVRGGVLSGRVDDDGMLTLSVGGAGKKA